MATPRQLEQARERFTTRFKRAVLERIEAQHAERAARSPAELNAERDALIRSMASEGRLLRCMPKVMRSVVSLHGRCHGPGGRGPRACRVPRAQTLPCREVAGG
jgi:hypothetical protein